MILKDHKHYVQGVSWDPLGHYLVTNSSDRYIFIVINLIFLLMVIMVNLM